MMQRGCVPSSAWLDPCWLRTAWAAESRWSWPRVSRRSMRAACMWPPVLLRLRSGTPTAGCGGVCPVNTGGRKPSFLDNSLFVSESDYGVDARRATGGGQTRENCDAEKNQRYDSDCRDEVGLEAIK